MAYTTIDKPTDYFNTVLYTGNGGSQNITGVGFSPDWVWLKGRNNANNHNLNDKVRGVNKQLYSDLTNAETTATTHLTAFDSDGFTLGNDGAVNGSSDTYVSWNWLAGGTASSNSNGSITSSVSANTTAGFSIVSYTGNGTSGATIGHGLSSAPSMIIFKSRSSVNSWLVYHKSIGATKFLRLEETDAEAVASSVVNDTAPTSSIITLGDSSGVNANGVTFIAYCFSEVKSFSKFGSYVGNLNDLGPFCFTGFKPAFVMVKDITTAENWFMYDNRRPGYNYNHYLTADTSGAEVTGDNWVDFTSNGFRLRKGQTGTNRSGDTYIYIAIAESPFVTSTGIPTTAR